MSSPQPIKVSVHVEVVIDGQTVHPVVTTVKQQQMQRARPRLQVMIIDNPSPSTNTPATDFPVYPQSAQNVVESNGECLTMDGSFPGMVYARAYPDPALDTSGSGFDAPPSNAVSDIPLNNGAWSFTRSKGNPIPNPAGDNTPSGANNSTLVVWYDFGTTTPRYSKETTPFHGLLTNCYGPPETSTRYATFTGSLSEFGTVPLLWNGVNWFAIPPGLRGAMLSLVKSGEECILLLAGPELGFTAAGKTTSTAPFVWSGTGAVSPLGHEFGVTITE